MAKEKPKVEPEKAVEKSPTDPGRFTGQDEANEAQNK
jgi:hypothetical protein